MSRATVPRVRWGLLLPAVATVVGATLVVLAAVAGHGLAERGRLALDGRVLGLAHGVEAVVREEGLESTAPLEELLAGAGPEVRGLELLGPAAEPLARLGATGGGLGSRDLVIVVGRRGSSPGGGPGHGRGGRLTLRLWLDPRAGQPPVAVRLLEPAAATAAIALVALAALGGRLLDRQRRAAEEEAARRRVEALGRAGAGLAHQLRTPLATLKGSCQLVAEELGPGRPRARLEAAVTEAERMERMLGLLLDFARPPEPQPEAVEVTAALARAARRDPRLEVVAEGGVTALVDPDHLEQILANLVDNALAASPAGGRVELRASSGGGRATVVVADSGPGPGADPEELFQPYVSRRANGTGLGLPIARSLAEANRGSLALRGRPGGGAEAVLVLPAGGGGP